MEEEQSLNEETGHGLETIGFLALQEGDIIGTTFIGEAGQVSDVGRPWQTITLERDYINPVVILSPNTFNESDPGVVRARNLTNNSFELHFEEWNYLDLNHAGETVSYLVFESGTHRLPDGTIIEARNSIIDSDFSSVSFNHDHDTTPLVFAQVASDNGPATVTTRLNSITADGFDVRVQEEEASATQRHVDETVSWIAIQPSSGNSNGVFYQALNGGDINHNAEEVLFTNFFDDPPAVFADLQTYNGNQTATVRQTETSATGVSLFVEEEQSFDNETGHAREDIGIFAISNGPISGFLLDFGSDDTSSNGGFGILPRSSQSTVDVSGPNSVIQQMIIARNEFLSMVDSAATELNDAPEFFTTLDDSQTTDTVSSFTTETQDQYFARESGVADQESGETTFDLEVNLDSLD